MPSSTATRKERPRGEQPGSSAFGNPLHGSLQRQSTIDLESDDAARQVDPGDADAILKMYGMPPAKLGRRPLSRHSSCVSLESVHSSPHASDQDVGELALNQFVLEIVAQCFDALHFHFYLHRWSLNTFTICSSLWSPSLETFCRKSKGRRISIFVLSASMLCISIPHAP